MNPLLFFITAFVFILGQYGATDLAMELVLRLNEGDFDKELYDSLREKLDLDKSNLRFLIKSMLIFLSLPSKEIMLFISKKLSVIFLLSINFLFLKS